MAESSVKQAKINQIVNVKFVFAHAFNDFRKC